MHSLILALALVLCATSPREISKESSMLVLMPGEKLIAKLGGAVSASQPEVVAFGEEFNPDVGGPGIPVNAIKSLSDDDEVVLFDCPLNRRMKIHEVYIRNQDSASVALTVAIKKAGALYEVDVKNVAAGGVWNLDSLKTAGHTHEVDQLRAGSLTDGLHIGLGTGTGTKIGTAASQKLGFFNATPVVQRTKAGDGGGTWTAGTLATALKNLGLIDADNS